MAEYEQKGRPSQELINHGTANQQHSSERDSAVGKSLQERNPFYKAFWDRFIEKSSVMLPLHDPAIYPADMLNKLSILIEDREGHLNPEKIRLAEKLTPFEDSIRKMRMAYQVIAYPHCQNWSSQDWIEMDLKMDSAVRKRDQVTLNDAEMEIIGKLCTTPRYKVYRDGTMMLQPEIPFNPQKRIYNYSEVINNPSTEITKIQKK
jgi:hypothetical protein